MLVNSRTQRQNVVYDVSSIIRLSLAAGDVLTWTVALDAVKWSRDSGTGIADTALAPLELVPYIGLSSAGVLSVGPYPYTTHDRDVELYKASQP